MKRRDFLKRATAGAAAASLGTACARKDGGGPAVLTGERVRWRLASSFPRSLDTIFGCAELFAETLKTMTGGGFEIRPYPAGELVPGLQVLDGVQQGAVEVGQTCGYYYTGKHPALAFDTCVPFGLTARQQSAWLHEAGGLALVNEVLADFGTLCFPGGNTGTQMGGWFKQAVGAPAELQGLRIRIPGMGGEVMSRLGASVQVIPGGEIYPALERGAIDAAEWVGPADDLKLGFHKVAKVYHYPGWWEPGASISFYVNQQAWGRLPATYQSAFAAAAAATSCAMQQRYDTLNPPALQQIVQSGVELRPFTDELMRAAQQAAEAILNENAAKDASYRKVHAHWQKFRKDAFRWFGLAELAYARFAFGR